MYSGYEQTCVLIVAELEVINVTISNLISLEEHLFSRHKCNYEIYVGNNCAVLVKVVKVE
jgi:hypothetical protein